MKAYERLLRYVRIHTASDDHSDTHPSTARQFDLAKILAEELTELGCRNVHLDEHCYVMAEIPASSGYENCPAIGFIAHMDTIPGFSGENVQPQIIENYDGGDVILGQSGLVLSPASFPHLPSLRGRTLITTDGTTLLGADDKAGIAEIMTLCEQLISGGTPHGKICIGFTPDEEIGAGTDCFDVEGFGARFAYTVDGGAEGSLEYENFNAAAAHIDIQGFSVHPGSAKDTMINAALVAMEINSLLPGADTPEHTSGYEGFYHLTDMSGNVSSASLDYIIRDHDTDMFAARKKTLEHIIRHVNEKYGPGTAVLTMRDQYCNMLEMVRPHFHLIDAAKEAVARCGVECLVEPIRGGTDGAMLSYKGLPCPNLGTGGYAYHGPYEHITAEGMDKQVDILREIVQIYAQKKD
ncbi:MAG: peptidase T [Ruminococcaceae bacterium]|nr:peptidase T [Oscillospiraceae bacterium]